MRKKERNLQKEEWQGMDTPRPTDSYRDKKSNSEIYKMIPQCGGGGGGRDFLRWSAGILLRKYISKSGLDSWCRRALHGASSSYLLARPLKPMWEYCRAAQKKGGKDAVERRKDTASSCCKGECQEILISPRISFSHTPGCGIFVFSNICSFWSLSGVTS